MDYMSLGSKSRKTGFRLNKNVNKDEYSMENMDDYFDDEENIDDNDSNFNDKGSGIVSGQMRKARGVDPNRSGLSIKSPSQMNIIPQTQGNAFTPIASTPTVKRSTAILPFNKQSNYDQAHTTLDNTLSTHSAYTSKLSDFHTNYDIPETIVEEEDGDELTADERRIRQLSLIHI